MGLSVACHTRGNSIVWTQVLHLPPWLEGQLEGPPTQRESTEILLVQRALMPQYPPSAAAAARTSTWWVALAIALRVGGVCTLTDAAALDLSSSCAALRARCSRCCSATAARSSAAIMCAASSAAAALLSAASSSSSCRRHKAGNPTLLEHALLGFSASLPSSKAVER